MPDEHFHRAVTQDNVLLGLTLIEQLFDQDTTAKTVAHNASEAYPDDPTEMVGSMLAAAMLVTKTIADRTGADVAEIIAALREELLKGDIDLPPLD